MSERLDELVTRLALAATDRPLGGLEMEIARSIRLRRRDLAANAALAPVRVAGVGLALALGLTAGGAVAVAGIAAPRSYGPFSSVAHLAPSTLLEARR